MPKPNCDDETRSEYLSRCIPEVMDEGLNHDQAVGRCIGMWNNAWKENQIDLDEIYQCNVCGNGMSFKDWYDADYYSVAMDEFYCPRCNQVIIAFDDLRILKEDNHATWSNWALFLSFMR